MNVNQLHRTRKHRQKHDHCNFDHNELHSMCSCWCPHKYSLPCPHAHVQCSLHVLVLLYMWVCYTYVLVGSHNFWNVSLLVLVHGVADTLSCPILCVCVCACCTCGFELNRSHANTIKNKTIQRNSNTFVVRVLVGVQILYKYIIYLHG